MNIHATNFWYGETLKLPLFINWGRARIRRKKRRNKVCISPISGIWTFCVDFIIYLNFVVPFRHLFSLLLDNYVSVNRLKAHRLQSSSGHFKSDIFMCLLSFWQKCESHCRRCHLPFTTRTNNNVFDVCLHGIAAMKLWITKETRTNKNETMSVLYVSRNIQLTFWLLFFFITRTVNEKKQHKRLKFICWM